MTRSIIRKVRQMDTGQRILTFAAAMATIMVVLNAWAVVLIVMGY